MKTCNCQNTAIQIEDQGTVAIVCAVHGRTYLFRLPGGGFETQEERRERMKSVRICERCEAEYQYHQHTCPGHSHAVDLCPACLKAAARPRNGGPRNNPNSPWRHGGYFTRGIRTGRCACGSTFETRSTNKFRCDPCQREADIDCMRMIGKARRSG